MSIAAVTALSNMNLQRAPGAREESGVVPPTARERIESAAGGRAAEVHESGIGAQERVVASLPSIGRGAGTSEFAPSDDSRYVRFVEAVQALRLDRELTTLTKSQIARIMQSGRDIFMLGDGLPREVRPLQNTGPVSITRIAEAAQEDAETDISGTERAEPLFEDAEAGAEPDKAAQSEDTDIATKPAHAEAVLRETPDPDFGDQSIPSADRESDAGDQLERAVPDPT